MAGRPAYAAEHGWLEDLKVEVKHNRKNVTTAAASLGMSTATAYRLIAEAKAKGEW
ncbi:MULTISPECIES: hypothetical protein [unclassified Aeromicrobium]|uniref:hypothetical protein n=1 Tax=unclassified Aeromicrobium TaxID=2633570 RepID=UPI00288A1127|nr:MULTISPECIES: hypothetical protein [unclassified Aeromicrobium]